MKTFEFTLNEQQRAKLALALAASSENGSEHLDSNALAALIEHNASNAESTQWKAHLTHCTECYSVFLQAAQWRLEHSAAEHAKKAQQKQKRGLLGKWRFAIGTVASVFVVTILFYLMPLNETAHQALSLQTPAEEKLQAMARFNGIDVDIAPEEYARQKERMLIAPMANDATQPAPQAQIQAQAILGKNEKDLHPVLGAATANEGAYVVRDAPITPSVPSLAELQNNPATLVEENNARLEDAKRTAQTPSEPVPHSAPTQSAGAVPQTANLPEAVAVPEQLEVTGSRIRRVAQSDKIPVMDNTYKQAVGEHWLTAFYTGFDHTDEHPAKHEHARRSSAERLGRWTADALQMCLAAPSNTPFNRFKVLAQEWVSVSTPLKREFTFFSSLDKGVANREQFCQTATRIKDALW